jgi:hypothetical protein
LQEFVQRIAFSDKQYISLLQQCRWTEVVAAIAYVENVGICPAGGCLIAAAAIAAVALAARSGVAFALQVVAETARKEGGQDVPLAHVDGTSCAAVSLEGLYTQKAFGAITGWVGEDLLEDLFVAVCCQDPIDED